MTLDWRSILGKHPLFSEIGPGQIDRLVTMSAERVCEPGEIVFREGELGSSIFLIGSGEVDVVLLREDDQRVSVARLPTGEVFGEMALLERKPRSATVLATQETALLEIEGNRYLELLRDHPHIESQLLSKLSERLRRLTDVVAAAKLHELDRKYWQLEARVDRELDALKSSQKHADLLRETMQERVQEASRRASEVLEQTTRNQDKLFQAIKIVGLVAGVASIALAAYGFKTWGDVMRSRDEVVEAAAQIGELQPAIDQLKGGLRLYRDFFEPQLYKTLAVDTVFEQYLRNGQLDEARKLFVLILESGNQDVSEYLLQWVMVEILKGEVNRDPMKELLTDTRDDLPKFHYRDRFLIDYLLLSAYVVDGEMGRYESIHPELSAQVGDYTGPSVRRSLLLDFSPANFEGHFYASLVTRSRRLSESGELSRLKDLASERAAPIREVWNEIP